MPPKQSIDPPGWDPGLISETPGFTVVPNVLLDCAVMLRLDAIQIAVLVALLRLSSRHRPLTAAQVAEFAGVSHSTAKRTLTALAEGSGKPTDKDEGRGKHLIRRVKAHGRTGAVKGFHYDFEPLAHISALVAENRAAGRADDVGLPELLETLLQSTPQTV